MKADCRVFVYSVFVMCVCFASRSVYRLRISLRYKVVKWLIMVGKRLVQMVLCSR